MPSKKSTSPKTVVENPDGDILHPDFQRRAEPPSVKAKKATTKKAAKPARAVKLFEIEISLREVHPRVWRRVLLPGDVNMSDVHEIIQFLMPWEGYHLHQFLGKGLRLSSYEEDPFDENEELQPEGEYQLDDLVSRVGSKFIYEYDFGDGWEHLLEVKAVHKLDAVEKPIALLDGAMACPPEDCGGPWGYMEIMAELQLPKSKRNHDLVQMLPKRFDPAKFNLERLRAAFGKRF